MRLSCPAAILPRDFPPGDAATERAWFGGVPVTEPGRTLDCAQTHLSPDLLAQTFQQARSRGLVSPERLEEVSRAAGLRFLATVQVGSRSSVRRRGF